MNREYKFSTGQKVKKRDEFGNWIKGEVVDWTTECVFIRWDHKVCDEQFFQYQFDKIYLINSKKA